LTFDNREAVKRFIHEYWLTQDGEKIRLRDVEFVNVLDRKGYSYVKAAGKNYVIDKDTKEVLSFMVRKLTRKEIQGQGKSGYQLLCKKYEGVEEYGTPPEKDTGEPTAKALHGR
jgi:hypothetical protein